MRCLGEDDAGGVRPDMPCDAGQDVEARPGMCRQAELGGADANRGVGCEGERGRAEGHRIDAQEQVVHDRVADDRDLEDLVDREAGSFRQAGDERGQRGPNGFRHLPRTVLVEHRVGHPAHEVLAKADLGIHHPVGREDSTVPQVREVTGDRRRSDVNGNAERSLVETRPDRREVAAVVDGDGDRSIAGIERRLELPDHVEVGLEIVEIPGLV